MGAAGWLTTTARAYHQSAGRLERMENEADFGGLTVKQWAIVYRAIAGELYKCSAAVQTPDIPVDLDGSAHEHDMAGCLDCDCNSAPCDATTPCVCP